MSNALYSIGDCLPFCLCVCVVKLFQIATQYKKYNTNKFLNFYSSYSFSPILAKLGTRDLCPNVHKTVEQIFKILILKCLAIF